MKPGKEKVSDTFSSAREVCAPFFSWEELASGKTQWEFLYPFFEGSSAPGQRLTVVRPLWSLQDEGPGSTRWAFRALWPFVLVERRDESGRLRVFPVIWWTDRVDRSGGGPERELDWAVMPILWGGTQSWRGSYFAVFPLGGIIKGKLGEKWIRFAAFPLWADYQNPGYHSWNLLWPVFGVWRGPEQSGWRVWPLCGVDGRRGRFRRVFVLWPFGHHWQTALDSDCPTETWVAVPFWLSWSNRKERYVSVLWPFFGRKQNYELKYVEWHAPWPFISWTRGEGVRGLKLWPFYAYRLAPRASSRTVLWPFYVRETADEAGERNTRVRSAYIFQYLRKEWVERRVGDQTVRQPPPRPLVQQELGAERRAGRDPELAGRKERPVEPGEVRSRVDTLLWPLFRYRRAETGERYFTALELWWWRNSEVFDRHYGPFLTLYRYQDLPDGTTCQHAAFNLFEHRHSPRERSVRLVPLFDYRRQGQPAETRRFRILYGLFGYERRASARRVRLLWIPIGRKPKDWENLPGPEGAKETKPPPAPAPAPEPQAAPEPAG